MSNEHISQLHEVGFGKESTAGTAVAVASWLNKMEAEYAPKASTDLLPANFGTIDAAHEGAITQLLTEITLKGSPRSTTFGNILLALFGLEYSCVNFPFPGSITGTFALGETVAESTSSATGVLRRADVSGSSKALYIVPVTGTFTGGQTLTGGTSGATATGGTIEAPGTVRHHVFPRANNNNHPSYTIYSHSPVEDIRAAYCMLDSLEIEIVPGKFVTFSAKFQGKMYATTTLQTPSYTTEYSLVGKHLTAKTASAFSGLDAASAASVTRMKVSFEKKLEVVQAFPGTDFGSQHNTTWDAKGDFTLLFNSTTQRDNFTAGTNQALRLTIANSGVTLGSAANPTLQLDFGTIFFNDYSKPDSAGELVKQTLTWSALRDATRLMPCEALLINGQTAAY